MSDGWWQMIRSIGYTNGGVDAFLEQRSDLTTLPEGTDPSTILKKVERTVSETRLIAVRQEQVSAEEEEAAARTKWWQAKGAFEKAQSDLRRGIDDVRPDYKNVHHLPDGFVRMEMRGVRTTEWNNRDSDELCTFQNVTEKRWFVAECTSPTINRLIDDVAKKSQERAAASARIDKATRAREQAQRRFEKALHETWMALEKESSASSHEVVG